MPTSVRTIAAFACGLVIAACVIQQPRDRTLPDNRYPGPAAADPPPGELAVGDYLCNFDDYPPFACRVYVDDAGGKVLEKLAGSQRIRGEVREDGGGFDFRGEFYCPYGDCTEQVAARFESFDGGHRGQLETRSGPIIVTLQYLPQGHGGAIYGGATYGGATYGGARYGGARYGTAR